MSPSRSCQSIDRGSASIPCMGLNDRGSSPALTCLSTFKHLFSLCCFCCSVSVIFMPVRRNTSLLIESSAFLKASRVLGFAFNLSRFFFSRVCLSSSDSTFETLAATSAHFAPSIGFWGSSCFILVGLLSGRFRGALPPFCLPSWIWGSSRFFYLSSSAAFLLASFSLSCLSICCLRTSCSSSIYFIWSSWSYFNFYSLASSS